MPLTWHTWHNRGTSSCGSRSLHWDACRRRGATLPASFPRITEMSVCPASHSEAHNEAHNIIHDTHIHHISAFHHSIIDPFASFCLHSFIHFTHHSRMLSAKHITWFKYVQVIAIQKFKSGSVSSVVSFCRWGTMCSRYFSWVPGPGDFQLSPSASFEGANRNSNSSDVSVSMFQWKNICKSAKIADELHRAPAPSHPGYHPDDKTSPLKKKGGKKKLRSLRCLRKRSSKKICFLKTTLEMVGLKSGLISMKSIQHSICTSLHVHIPRPAWSNSNTSHTFFDPSRPQYGLENPPGTRWQE